MIDILSRAGCFVAIIFLGMILRRVGFFKREDFNLLSKIVIRITLPAAIITNLAGREFAYSLFVLIAVGSVPVRDLQLRLNRQPADQCLCIPFAENTVAVHIACRIADQPEFNVIGAVVILRDRAAVLRRNAVC